MSIEADGYGELLTWLSREATTQGLRIQPRTQSARVEGRYLHVPVYLEGVSGVYERASTLQRLEDSWNNREPEPERLLFIIPAAN